MYRQRISIRVNGMGWEVKGALVRIPPNAQSRSLATSSPGCVEQYEVECSLTLVLEHLHIQNFWIRMQIRIVWLHIEIHIFAIVSWSGTRFSSLYVLETCTCANVMLLSNQGPSEEFPSQGLLFTNMVGNKVNHGDEVGSLALFTSLEV